MKAVGGFKRNKRIVGIAVGFVLLLIIWFMPTPAGLSVKGQQTLAMLIWALTYRIFEIEHPMIAGIVMPAFFSIFNVASSAKIFAGFVSPITHDKKFRGRLIV